jgi:alpha-mannosidase
MNSHIKAWDAAWKTVLLNQFHDILPGSSIARVHDEAEAQLSNVVNWSKDALRNIGRALARSQGGISVFNSLSWPRTELVEIPGDIAGLEAGDGAHQCLCKTTGGKSFAEVNLPACGWESFAFGKPSILENTLKVRNDLLENDLVRVRFNEFGEITSIYDKAKDYELAEGICNQLAIVPGYPQCF